MRGLFDMGVLSTESVSSGYIIFFLYFSQGVFYDHYKEDPIFPATSKAPDYIRNSLNKTIYTNLNPRPTIVGCIDNTYICTPSEGCWTRPDAPVSQLDHLRRTENPPYQPDTTRHSLPAQPITSANVSEPTDADLAHILLSNALWDTNLCSKANVWTRKPKLDSCTGSSFPSADMNFPVCSGLPLDQWKIEVRQRFEASLAQIQFQVLKIVRGAPDGELPYQWNRDYDGIPPAYRGLCSMGKFNSVGWRNVSAWGLFALLAFAAGVSLASVRTEEDELWLLIGARRVVAVVCCTVKKVRKLLWMFPRTRTITYIGLAIRKDRWVLAWLLRR